MIIKVADTVYSSAYYPFYRLKVLPDHTLFGMRLPSGAIEKIKVYDQVNWIKSLNEYTHFLITEYMLEDDDILTPRAQNLKYDLQELFDATRNE